MNSNSEHVAHIRNTRNSHYHIVIRDGFRLIDEEVDGPKLLAMLGRETLVNTRGETVAAEDILYRLDSEVDGYEIVIGVKERAA